MTTPDIDSLRAGFNGEVILPDHPAYDEHRRHFNQIYTPTWRGRNPEVPCALAVRPASTWSISTGVYWENQADDERNRAWSDALFAALADAGLTLDWVYGNMQASQDRERDRRSYGEENWKRLTELKAKYDPDNVFHLNHNIPPAA